MSRYSEYRDEEAAEGALLGLALLYGTLKLLVSFKFLFVIALAVALGYWLL